jgi:hypothetical protein
MVGAASQTRASLHNSTDRGWEAAPTKILQMPTIKSAGLLISIEVVSKPQIRSKNPAKRDYISNLK